VVPWDGAKGHGSAGRGAVAVRATVTTTDLVAHLYRRAGFGAVPTERERWAAAGYNATVQALVAGLHAPDTGADALPAPAFGAPVPAAELRTMDVASRRALSQRIHQEFVSLTGWWLGRMLATTNPLKEKLTFLLHNHYPTAISKVRYPVYMYGQNQVFRSQGGGDFTALTQAVAQDPAMLLWLDANSNKASNPNENFARELMERFTMGIGTYSQADVRAASYCFTGWRLDPRTDHFSIAARLHTTAPQTFLGQSGITSGQQVIDIVTTSEASSRFVPSRLWNYLAYPVAPSDPVVTDLAPAYAADRNITNLLTAIFEHPAFTQRRSLEGLVKQPTEYVVGALRALGVTPADVAGPRSAQLVPVFAGLGQVLFDPPSVGGWPQNGYWLSTASALARWKFAHRLARTTDISVVADAAPGQRVDAAAHLLSVSGWSPTTAAALGQAAHDPPTLVTLALASPDYVSN
jgi:uncharacterized protein (DUF1800 family)